MKQLTEKQMKAAQERAKGKNRVEAYKEAYDCLNKNAMTIKRKASILFQKPHVAAYVEELQQQVESQAIMERRDTLVVLSEIARGKVSDFLTESGEIDPAKVANAGPELESYSQHETDQGTVRKLKLRDSVKAIERLAKMQGWDKAEKLEVEGVTFNLNMGTGDQQNGQ